jgi:predicted nucleic acid-binding protein
MLPLLVREPETAAARRVLEEDGGIAAWWTTPAECWSALARLRREEVITLAGETAAHRVLEALRGSWLEILPSEPVRETAKRLLRGHALRAADALQLGAAIIWGGGGAGRELVTLDERLAVAAELEGFRVLAPTVVRRRRGRTP